MSRYARLSEVRPVARRTASRPSTTPRGVDEVAGAPRQVLAERVLVAAADVARLEDPVDEIGAVLRVVREVGLLHHLAGMPVRGPPELGVRAQALQAAGGALFVVKAHDGVADLLQVSAVGYRCADALAASRRRASRAERRWEDRHGRSSSTAK